MISNIVYANRKINVVYAYLLGKLKL